MTKGTLYFSWEALTYDYLRDNVSLDGPTVTLHRQKVQNQDCHILFYTNPNEENSKRITRLKDCVINQTQTTNSQIRLIGLDIPDAYDLRSIKLALQDEVQRIIDEYPKYELAFLA